MVKLYPLFLNIEQKNCLVVGGGSVACRKVKNLLECGASVEVITMEAQEELIKLSQEPHSPVKMTLRPFQPRQLRLRPEGAADFPRNRVRQGGQDPWYGHLHLHHCHHR